MSFGFKPLADLRFLRLPVGLKLLSVFGLLLGFYMSYVGIVLWTSRDPGPNIYSILGLGTLVATVGVMLMQKWAWYVSVATATACVVCDALIVLVLLTDQYIQFTDAPALMSVSCLAIGLFSLYYLNKRRIRALFGIGSPRP